MQHPKHIRLERRNGADFTLELDGKAFPHCFEIFSVDTDPDCVPAVTITLRADRVEVVNDISTTSDKD